MSCYTYTSMKKYFAIVVLTFLPVLFTITKTSALSCINLTKTLSKGSENSEVMVLQQFLFDNGYLTVKPNGYFGENTKKAVIAFQRKQKISSSGAVGKLTTEKIKEISCQTVSNSTEKKSSKSVTNKNEEKVVEVKDIPIVTVTNEIPTIYVKTLFPKDITATGATLNGSGGIDGEKHWFEWGKTMEMSNVTPQNVSSTTYSYKITGLTPNTTYYFRAITSVATSTNGKGEIAYGDRRYFVTPTPDAVPPPVPTVTISSTGIAVNSIGSAKVTWSSANVTTCTFTGGEEGGDWSKQGSLSGQYITKPITKSTIFGIGCKNILGQMVTGIVTIPKIVN